MVITFGGYIEMVINLYEFNQRIFGILWVFLGEFFIKEGSYYNLFDFVSRGWKRGANNYYLHHLI